MNSPTIVKMHIEVERQKMLNAFMLHQEEIADGVTKGVDAAVKNFDFEKEVKEQAISLIKREIQDLVWNGEMRKLIHSKVSNIISDLIEKEMAVYNTNQQTKTI